MNNRLQRLLAIRFRISTQIYLGIGALVALTVAASLVGWFSFSRVGDAQNLVNEGSVPELEAAFRIAEYSGALVAAAPSLTAASTPDEFDRISSSISADQVAFEEQIALLESRDPNDERFQGIRSHADALIVNIDGIKGDRAELFRIGERSQALRTELANLRSRLDGVVIPAIDDQLFYTMTGYRNLVDPTRPYV